MPTSFLHLPGEIRNEIYRYLLVHEGTIKPWDGDHELSPNILATNKTILHEARSILYGNNCFDLSLRGRSPYRIQVFFGIIGIINMGYFRSIRLDFPRFDWDKSEALDDISLSNLAIIASFCARLETVTMTPFSIDILTSCSKLLERFSYPGCPTIETYGTLLAQVDSSLREIPAVKHIIVEAYQSPGEYLTKEMEGLGWTIRIVKEPEDWLKERCPVEDDDTQHRMLSD